MILSGFHLVGLPPQNSNGSRSRTSTKMVQKKLQQIIPESEKSGKDWTRVDRVTKISIHLSRDSLPVFAWKYFSMVQGGPPTS